MRGDDEDGASAAPSHRAFRWLAQAAATDAPTASHDKATSPGVNAASSRGIGALSRVKGASSWVNVELTVVAFVTSTFEAARRAAIAPANAFTPEIVTENGDRSTETSTFTREKVTFSKKKERSQRTKPK